MDLFETQRHLRTDSPQNFKDSEIPFAHKIRPKNLDEFYGHENFLSKESPLRFWIEQDTLPSLVFWGPPGSGKTTLAEIISQKTNDTLKLSAVSAGIKDIKELVEKAQFYLETRSTKTILFLDEIHRFNKSQQDSLLPHLESGLITLIGATTENPSFELNAALLSRVKVIRFESHSEKSLLNILKELIPFTHLKKGTPIEDEALIKIAQLAQGDARDAINILESILSSGKNSTEIINVDSIKIFLETLSQQKAHLYDKKGEEHYNVISAFIKSMRSSDAQAAIYYLARMLDAGEDPLFIVRRMIIFASEDIGNADPRALQMALACKEAVHFVGMPEARINLAHGVTYLSMAPKSNASYEAINEALQEVRSSGALPVPLHLRNGVTDLMKDFGYGKNYQYAHHFENAKVTQTHLPEKIKDKIFYRPKRAGYEKNFLHTKE